MMSEERDGMLTSEQQQALRSFQEITQLSNEYLCMQILDQNGWNLERSVSSFMQGGVAESDSDDEVEMVPTYQRQSTSEPSTSRSINQSDLREVPAQQVAVNQQNTGGSLLDLVFIPLRWLFQPRALSLNPGLDTQNFITDFISEYGQNRPNFHNGPYQSAVTMAFNSTKFVLVYLHSPLHEDSDRFSRDVLTNSSFIQLTNEEVILWGGKVWDAEAYGLSMQLGAAAYPFMALLVPQSGRVVQIAERIEGYSDVNSLLERLRRSMSAFAAVFRRQREEQRRRDESTRLREQQNREYQEAVEAERREFENKRKEEELRLAAEEQKRAEEEEAAAVELSKKLFHEDTIRKIRTIFSNEQEPKPGADVATIRFQLPRAKKLTRNFYKHETIKKINQYLQLHFADEGDITSNFAMFIPHPRTEISNLEQTVEEAGLYPRGMLYVQDLDT